MFGNVQAGDILEVIWVSLAAGIFVSTVYSIVVLGSARSGEARRSGNGTGALVWGGVAVLAFVLFAGAVVFGVQVMLSKD